MRRIFASERCEFFSKILFNKKVKTKCQKLKLVKLVLPMIFYKKPLENIFLLKFSKSFNGKFQGNVRI